MGKIKYVKGRLILTKVLQRRIRDFEFDHCPSHSPEYNGGCVFQIDACGRYNGLMLPHDKAVEVSKLLKPFYDEDATFGIYSDELRNGYERYTFYVNPDFPEGWWENHTLA